MPANRLSLAVTDVYRTQVAQASQAAQATVRLLWARIPQGPRDDQDGLDLDAAYEAFLAQAIPALSAAQTRAVGASQDYLTAFLTSELGRPAQAPQGETQYVGQSRDGRPLRDVFAGPLIGVKAELKRGRDLADALRIGQSRAARLAGMEVDHAARGALQDGLVADERIVGYRRAVRGTCGACLGAATGVRQPGDDFLTHPGCQCYPEPVVRGVRDRFPRPSGVQLFGAMTKAEQDRAVGPEVAEAVRAGEVALADLVERNRQKRTQDFVTQTPKSALL